MAIWGGGAGQQAKCDCWVKAENDLLVCEATSIAPTTTAGDVARTTTTAAAATTTVAATTTTAQPESLVDNPSFELSPLALSAPLAIGASAADAPGWKFAGKGGGRETPHM